MHTQISHFWCAAIEAESFVNGLFLGVGFFWAWAFFWEWAFLGMGPFNVRIELLASESLTSGVSPGILSTAYISIRGHMIDQLLFLSLSSQFRWEICNSALQLDGLDRAQVGDNQTVDRFALNPASLTFSRPLDFRVSKVLCHGVRQPYRRRS